MSKKESPIMFSYVIPSGGLIELAIDPNPAETHNVVLRVSDDEEQVMELHMKRTAVLQLGRAFMILGESA